MEDVRLAIAAAEAGSTVVRAMYGEPMARFVKSPTDFATAADLAAEEAILDVLRAARPGDAFLGEESGSTGDSDSRRTWLVDPLCGTLNYAAGTTLVAVNVALRTDDEVRVAATADPFAGEVFWTDGRQAFVRRGDADEPLRPSADTRIVDVNLDAPFPNAPGFRAVRLLAEPDFTELFRPRVVSTTLAVAWVAAGRRAGYVTDGHLRGNVHFAGGIALCKAAGCVVTDLQGRPESARADGGLVAAADEETHARLLTLVRRQLAREAER